LGHLVIWSFDLVIGFGHVSINPSIND